MRKTLALLALVLSFLTGCAKESASVGVIGGADGPTAIMVSGGSALPMSIIVLGIVIIVAIIVVFITHKKD